MAISNSTGPVVRPTRSVEPEAQPHGEPACSDDGLGPITDQYRETLTAEIDLGLAAAGRGELVDGPTVLARLRAKLDQLESQSRG